MSDRRSQWSSAHADLWTSFKRHHVAPVTESAEQSTVQPVAAYDPVSPRRTESASQSPLLKRVAELEAEIAARDLRVANCFSTVAAAINAACDPSLETQRSAASLEAADKAVEVCLGANPSPSARSLMEALRALETTVHRVKPLPQTRATLAKVTLGPVKQFANLIGGENFAKRVFQGFKDDATMSDSDFENCVEVCRRLADDFINESFQPRPLHAPEFVASSSILGKARGLVETYRQPTLAPEANLELRKLVDLLGGDSLLVGDNDLSGHAARLALQRSRDIEILRRDLSAMQVSFAQYESWSTSALSNLGVDVTFSAGDIIESINSQSSEASITKRKLDIVAEDSQWMLRTVARLEALVSDISASTSVIPSENVASVATNRTRRAVGQVIGKLEGCVRERMAIDAKAQAAAVNIVARCSEVFGGMETFSDLRAKKGAAGVLATADALEPVLSEVESVADSCRDLVAACGLEMNQRFSFAQVAQRATHIVKTISKTAAAQSKSAAEIGRMCEVFSEIEDAISARWSAICELLRIEQPIENDNNIERLRLQLVAILMQLPPLRERMEAESQQAAQTVEGVIQRVAQLLVTDHGSTEVTVPSIRTVDELVAALGDRMNMLHAHWQRHSNRVSSATMEQRNLEEGVRRRCVRWIALLRPEKNGVGTLDDDDAMSMDDAATNDEGVQTSEALLNRVDALIQNCRSRISKLGVTHAADRVRFENLQKSHEQIQRRWSLIGADLLQLAQVVGVPTETTSLVKSDDHRGFIRACQEYLSKRSSPESGVSSEEELRQLRRQVSDLKVERSHNSRALADVTMRLCTAARTLKQAMFTIGSDESSDDAVVEAVLNNQMDSISYEDVLADLLGKLGRWVMRIEDTTSKVMDNQKIALNCLTKVYRAFFDTPCEYHDANILDISESLRRLTEDMVQDIDVKISNFTATLESTLPAPSWLMRYDPRLGRLQKISSRLHRIIEGLTRVKFLSIPPPQGVSNGRPLPPLPTSDADGHASPTRESVGFFDIDPDAQETTTDDLLRILEKNMDHVRFELQTFSNSFKQVSITIQNDMEELQKCTVATLRSLTEHFNIKSMGYDEEKVAALLCVMEDRATRQRGCYFFNRPEGQETMFAAPWVQAASMVSESLEAIAETWSYRSEVSAHLKSQLEAIGGLVGEWLKHSSTEEDPQQNLQTSTAAADVTTSRVANDAGETIVRTVERLVLFAIDRSLNSDRCVTLDAECQRLHDQVQLLSERVAVSEGKLQSVSATHRDAIVAIEQERDQALSEAAVLRSQLRRLAAQQTSMQQHHRYAKESEIPEMVSCSVRTSPSGRRGQTKSDEGPTNAEFSLSSVESYMRNLERELERRQLCDLPTRQSQRQRSPVGSRTNLSRPHTMMRDEFEDAPISSKSAKVVAQSSRDIVERERSRSGSNARSRSNSSPRSVMFRIPVATAQPNDTQVQAAPRQALSQRTSTNLHSTIDHYLETGTSRTMSSRESPMSKKVPPTRAQQQQCHVVVVSPRKLTAASPQTKLATTARKSSLSDAPSSDALHAAVATIVSHANKKRPSNPSSATASSSPAAQLVNLESEGMMKLVGAVATPSIKN